MTQIDYIGNELELFKYAVNWKAYYRGVIDPYIAGDVCEVGAGIGGTTVALLNAKVNSWLAVEPDDALSAQISNEISGHPMADKVRIQHGTLMGVEPHRKFNTIIYIDVIEHIEDHQAEFNLARGFLAPGGHLIILVPAFNFLYSPFDKAIGHYRRYSKKMLRSLDNEEGLKLCHLKYYDCLGFMASLTNKLLLNKDTPSTDNIKLWDGFLVPLSRIFDKIFLHSFGKSLIGIWKNAAEE